MASLQGLLGDDRQQLSDVIHTREGMVPPECLAWEYVGVPGEEVVPCM